MTSNQNNSIDDALPRDDADLLISRAVDGRTSQAEWVLLELAAAQDSSVWRRLAQAHRDHALLVKGIAHAAEAADRTELPSRMEAERAAAAVHSHFLTNARSWGGWAAAAILTLAVIMQTNRTNGTSQAPGSNSPAGTSTAGVPGLATAADAFNAYLNRGKEEGRVLGEVPDQVLVDSRPAENGEGYDVVYVRQVLEKARVADLYRFSHDEAGRATPVRVRSRSTQQQLPTVY